MKRAITLLTLLMILISILAMPSQAEEYANHVVGTREGVVRIYSREDGSSYYSTGSGFAIGTAGEPTSVFATNFHVVDDADVVYILLDNDWRKSVPAAGGVEDGVHAVRCEVIYQSTSGPDYAILKADRIITERVAVPLMESHLAYPGDWVYTLGYPGSSDEITDTVPADIDSMTVTTGTISRFTYYNEEKSNVIQIDSVINHGNSGGPLITEQGYVIGLNTWGVPDPDTDQIVYLALEVDYVINALDELISSGKLPNFSYTLISDRPEDTPIQTSPQEPTAAPAPTESAQPETTEAAQETTVPHQDENNSYILYISIGAGFILILIALFLIRISRIRGGSRTVPANQEYAASRVSPAQYNLTGISGSYAGRSISIAKPLTLGRASNCDIRFAEGTSGVSRIHCQIIASENCVLLIDLGSSVGTYLENGTRLTAQQQYPLKHGDVFYVGNRSQSFRIDQAGLPVRPVQPAPASSVSYTITGVDGAFAGRRMTLSREMVFGRNSGCDVVFPENTSGISSRHFVMTPREDGIILMDLGSTYGTFLANGSKLAPNQKVMIRKGESFSVGGMKHRFRVD